MDKGKNEKAVVWKRWEGMKMERAERYLQFNGWKERVWKVSLRKSLGKAKGYMDMATERTLE